MCTLLGRQRRNRECEHVPSWKSTQNTSIIPWIIHKTLNQNIAFLSGELQYSETANKQIWDKTGDNTWPGNMLSSTRLSPPPNGLLLLDYTASGKRFEGGGARRLLHFHLSSRSVVLSTRVTSLFNCSINCQPNSSRIPHLLEPLREI